MHKFYVAKPPKFSRKYGITASLS